MLASAPLFAAVFAVVLVTVRSSERRKDQDVDDCVSEFSDRSDGSPGASAKATVMLQVSRREAQQLAAVEGQVPPPAVPPPLLDPSLAVPPPAVDALPVAPPVVVPPPAVVAPSIPPPADPAIPVPTQPTPVLPVVSAAAPPLPIVDPALGTPVPPVVAVGVTPSPIFDPALATPLPPVLAVGATPVPPAIVDPAAITTLPLGVAAPALSTPVPQPAIVANTAVMTGNWKEGLTSDEIKEAAGLPLSPATDEPALPTKIDNDNEPALTKRLDSDEEPALTKKSDYDEEAALSKKLPSGEESALTKQLDNDEESAVIAKRGSDDEPALTKDDDEKSAVAKKLASGEELAPTKKLDNDEELAVAKTPASGEKPDLTKRLDNDEKPAEIKKLGRDEEPAFTKKFENGEEPAGTKRLVNDEEPALPTKPDVRKEETSLPLTPDEKQGAAKHGGLPQTPDAVEDVAAANAFTGHVVAPDAESNATESSAANSTLNSSPYSIANSTPFSIRLDMALRALRDDGSTDDSTSDEQPVDDAFDPDMISGSSAELAEAGYGAVAELCCPIEMATFTERAIKHLGFVVCNEGSLQGMIAWYYCKNQTRTFQELVEDVVAGSDGECAWIGTASSCPTLSQNCPSFPDTAGHRRRSCHFRRAANTTTTTRAPPDSEEEKLEQKNVSKGNGSTVAPEAFSCEPGVATDLVFRDDGVAVNNLGGLGPGTGDGEMRFQGIGTVKAKDIDMVVQAVSDYVPMNVSENGVVDKLGQINVKSGTSVDLMFKFQDTETHNPVRLPEFYFTLLDIDQSDGQRRERIYASDYVGDVRADIQDFDAELLPDGRTLYKSQKVGGRWDDPDDPERLSIVVDKKDPSHTVDQNQRSVMLVFRQRSQFVLTLEVTQDGDAEPEGRNFLFAGKSSLIDFCK